MRADAYRIIRTHGVRFFVCAAASLPLTQGTWGGGEARDKGCKDAAPLAKTPMNHTGRPKEPAPPKPPPPSCPQQQSTPTPIVVKCATPEAGGCGEELGQKLKSIDETLSKGNTLAESNTKELVKAIKDTLAESNKDKSWWDKNLIAAVVGGLLGLGGGWLGAWAAFKLNSKDDFQKRQRQLAIDLNLQYANLLEYRGLVADLFRQFAAGTVANVSQTDLISRKIAVRELGNWYDFLAVTYNKKLADQTLIDETGLYQMADDFKKNINLLRADKSLTSDILGSKEDIWPNLTKMQPQ